MDHLNVWEAVDGFNQRSAAGRVVVNPPSKRGKVKAFPTQESWCLCRCGRAFSCTAKYVEHKLSHEAVGVNASVKLSPRTTKAIFKKYSGFRIKKENGRLVKSCKTEIQTTTVSRHDHVISRFDEDNVRLPVTKVKVEAKSNKRRVSFQLKQEEYPSKPERVITVFKEAKEVDKVVASESNKSSSLKPSRINAVPGYHSDKVFTRPTALNPTLGKQFQADQNKDCYNPDLQTGGFKCEICQLIIRTQIGLFRHRVVKHKGEGVIRCKICKYCFASLHSLQVHMRRFHRGTNPCKINTRLNGSKLMSIKPGDNRGVSELLGGKNERKRKTSIDKIASDVVLDDGGGSHPSENQNENDFQYKFSNFKGTRSGAPNKFPNYQCLKCCKIFLSAGLLRRHNISKHPDSVTAIQASYCVKCDKPCGGTCTVQRSRSSNFRKKSQNGIRSRLVSLRSSARKPTREASSNVTNLSLMDVNQRTSPSPISETKSTTEEKLTQVAQVEKELSVENSRSFPSLLIESQPKVPEGQLENKPIFYDAVGTRTRSKNSTENSENASLTTSDQKNDGSIGTPLSLNKFVCKFCGLQRGSIRSVVQHIRWHHSRKPFRRQLGSPEAKYKPNALSSRNSNCSGTDTVLDVDDSTVGLQSSSTSVLTGKKRDGRVECKTCHVKISRSRYEQHLLSQTHLKVKFECVICSRRYMYQSWLKVHMRTHGHVACDKCDKTFQYPSMLKLHKRSHEREQKQKQKWDCETRGEVYKEQPALSAHKTAVHGIVEANGESLKDKTCGKKDRPARLQRFHKQADSTSTSNSLFECDICHFKLKSARNLLIHIKSCHVAGGKFPCSYCPCVLGSVTSLIAHTGKRHKLRKNPSLENDCNTTIVAQNFDADKLNNSSLSSEDTLENSLKVNCKKCRLPVSKGGYAKHLKVAHVKLGKFPCISCSCVFGSPVSLQIHKQRQHYQERNKAETSLGANGIANASTASSSTTSTSTTSTSTASSNTASTRPRRNSDLPRKSYGKSVSILSKPNDEAMLNSTPIAINSITCTLCKLSIPGSSPEMAVHKKTAHVKNSEYGCNYCSCAFKDDHGLKLHLSTVIHTSTSEDKNEKLLRAQNSPAIQRMETKTEGQRRNDSIRSKKISRLATNPAISTNVNIATRVSTRNSARSVRRKMFSSSSFPSKVTTTTTNNTEDAISYLSSTITSPIYAQNYQQLFPPDLFTTTDNVIKPEIMNANSDSDANFPVIVNCFSQNPEYLKKHSPQKTESEIITTTKSSRISKLSSKFKLPSNHQNPTNDELIRKSAAMSASSIVWSPPKRITISSQKSMVTSRASLAIQNLLANQSLTVGGSVSDAAPKLLNARSLSRSENSLNREKRFPVSVETSMFTSPITRSLLGFPPANADDNIFKVPLPPRPTRSKSVFTIVSTTSNSLTASVADRTRRIETIGTSSIFQQPQQPVTQARGLNNFIFPSLNLDQPSSTENALVRPLSTDTPYVPSSPSIVRASPTPTATVTPTGTYIHNYQQSSDGPTVSFPQTSFVSSLLPKFQNKKPCPFVANPKTQASTVFESQQPIYGNCGTLEDPVIQNHLPFSTSTIEDKNSNNGPTRARLVTCNICTKSFFGQTKLSNHMKIHEADNSKEMTPQKPKPGGKCGYCGETFIIHSALWAHLKVCSSPGSPASSSLAVNGFL